MSIGNIKRTIGSEPNNRLHADAQTYVLFVVSLRSIYHKNLSGLGAGEPGVSIQAAVKYERNS
jgi:hypothetical protein